MKRPAQQKGAKGKQLRRPVSNNFSPKRLAINFDPPMIILEYLIIDSGKLYHHKMRLDTIVRKPKVSREDVLNYIKTKHHLYFLNGKVKDELLLKFIDKVLIKMGKMTHPGLQNKVCERQPVSQVQERERNSAFDDDFDYLNEDQEYEEDYEDQPVIPEEKVVKEEQPKKKNAFLTYCQDYEEEEEEQEDVGQAWDLDMDQNADFV